MLPLEKYHLINDDELGPVLFLYELSEPFYTDVFYAKFNNYPRDPDKNYQDFTPLDAELTHADHVKIKIGGGGIPDWYHHCNAWVVKESNRVKAAKEVNAT